MYPHPKNILQCHWAPLSGASSTEKRATAFWSKQVRRSLQAHTFSFTLTHSYSGILNILFLQDAYKHTLTLCLTLRHTQPKTFSYSHKLSLFYINSLYQIHSHTDFQYQTHITVNRRSILIHLGLKSLSLLTVLLYSVLFLPSLTLSLFLSGYTQGSAVTW